MKYGSLFSGIEAASVAWESLGWEPRWFAEIEHFPSAVLAHRFPTVPNLGDVTKIHETKIFNGNSIDLLVGGSPCQSFSVAGLRKGLDDPRGQLMYTFVELAARKRPKWVVWENVPGVLSSNKGGDFASFLGLLTGRDIQAPVGGWSNSGCIEGISSAYGVAWTMLDAQDYGLAQRRKRIFVIGYLGDWRPAAAVLFERNRLSGDTAKSREKRKATSSNAEGGIGIGSQYWGSNPECSDTVTSKWHKGSGGPAGSECGLFVSHPAHAFKVRGGSETETGEQGGIPGKKAGKGYLGQDEKAFTIGTTQDQQIAQPIAVDCYNQTINERTTQTIGSSASDVNHYGAVLTPIAVDTYNQTTSNVNQTIKSPQGGLNESIGVVLTPPTIIDRAAFNQGQNAQYDIKIEEGQTMSSLVAKGPHGVATQKPPTMAIRRLLPTECEILQGFPRNWTLIPYRNKPAEQCPDGPRYKACGNSMAVPVMAWLGRRIQMVEDILKQQNDVTATIPQL